MHIRPPDRGLWAFLGQCERACALPTYNWMATYLSINTALQPPYPSHSPQEDNS